MCSYGVNTPSDSLSVSVMLQSIKPFTCQSCSRFISSTLLLEKCKTAHFSFLPYILWLLTRFPEHVLGPTSGWPWSWKCSTLFWPGLDWALEKRWWGKVEEREEDGEKQQATQSIIYSNSKVQNQLSMKEISHYQFTIPLSGMSSDSRNIQCVGESTVLCVAVCEGDG